MKRYILMADVIGSQTKNQKLLMSKFRDLVFSANTQFAENIISPLTITLGDEFQGVVDSLNTALRVIIFLEEESIKKNVGFQCRYVLKYGNIDTSINKAIAYEMLGDGLTVARQRLSAMKTGNQRFILDVENDKMNQILHEAFIIFNSIISTWNVERDHILISTFIENEDYKLVAKELERDPSGTWKRNITLNMDSYFAIKKIMFFISN